MKVNFCLGLHRRAGTKNLIEMHGKILVSFQRNFFFKLGNLFMVRCTSCEFIEENNSSPICQSLANRGFQQSLLSYIEI